MYNAARSVAADARGWLEIEVKLKLKVFGLLTTTMPPKIHKEGILLIQTWQVQLASLTISPYH
jgi:hypothetical protein